MRIDPRMTLQFIVYSPETLVPHGTVAESAVSRTCTSTSVQEVVFSTHSRYVNGINRKFDFVQYKLIDQDEVKELPTGRLKHEPTSPN